MTIKLLAVDMDGTCLNDKNKISEEDLHWLRKAKEHNIEIIPTTGRALSCIPYQLKKEESLYSYVISSNGGVLTDIRTNENVFSALISKEEAINFLKEIKAKGLIPTAHINHDYILQGKFIYKLGKIEYGKDAYNSITTKDLVSYIQKENYDIEEIQLYFMKKGTVDIVKEKLLNHPDLIAAYDSIYVEIYSKNASKGNALKIISEKLGIKKSEIACIGNGENDISMFENSYLSFAVENSDERLKKKASEIVASNNNSAVSQAIKYVFNINDINIY